MFSIFTSPFCGRYGPVFSLNDDKIKHSLKKMLGLIISAKQPQFAAQSMLNVWKGAVTKDTEF